MYIDAVILFIFGTIIGSFINALAFRHNTGKSMWGRSGCTSCGTTLKNHDLIPVVSYLFLKGRCRACKATISMHYPLVEVIAGVVSALAYLETSAPVNFILSFAFFMVLLFIAVYDLRHTIIPDQFVIAAALIALLFRANESGVFSLPSATYVLAGPLLALPLAAIWFFSHGRAMGLGDGKLMVAIGFFLGLSQGIASFLISFYIGAIVGVFLLFVSAKAKGKMRVTMKSEVPFGPFIVLSCAIVYFFHLSVSTLLFF